MPWQNIRISRFGGPEVLELAEQPSIPDPGPGAVRIKVLAAGTGFTDSFIRRGRYPDYKGPLPFTPGYELVGVIEKSGPGVTVPRDGALVADLCVVGGYAQYAIRPARFLVPLADGLDPAEAVCIPLAYLTAFQMLTRVCHLLPKATILVIGASGSAGDFVATVRQLTTGRNGGAGVDAAFDAIGGAHFARSYACLAPGGMLVGYGSQTMAAGGEGLLAAGLGLARLRLWDALSWLFGGRHAAWFNITGRRLAHPEEFKADMATLFGLLRDGAIHPVVIDRLPLRAARDVHTRIDAGGLGGKIVLLPWLT